MKEPAVPMMPIVVFEVPKSVVMRRSNGDAIQKNE
jgi:hypothetical protein